MTDDDAVYTPDLIDGGIEALRAMPDDAFVAPARQGGLKPMSAAHAIHDALGYGWSPVERTFYIYRAGRWVPDEHVVDAAITALLGDRYRPGHRSAVLDVMRTLPGVQTVSAEPVGHDRWINVRNGLVEWRTSRLFDHVPEACGITQLPVEWDADAGCPTFERFLAEVLPPDCLKPTDESPQGFIWEVIGYAIFSGNPLQKAFMLMGDGGNGKGRFLHVLETLAGRENVSSVGLHELVGNRFRAATLYGKLLNVAGDLDPRWLEDTAVFKKITGGDSIQAERKFGHPFDFTPWATPFYSTNKPFGSADTSEGYWRRWIVLPFPYNHRSSSRTSDQIDAANVAELPGILVRAVAALGDLMSRGRFVEPESVAEAKDEFRAQADRVRGWLRDEASLADDAWTDQRVLYESFRIYVESGGGGRPLSKREFYARLRQVEALSESKRRGIRGFRGITIRADRP